MCTGDERRELPVSCNNSCGGGEEKWFDLKVTKPNVSAQMTSTSLPLCWCRPAVAPVWCQRPIYTLKEPNLNLKNVGCLCSEKEIKMPASFSFQSQKVTRFTWKSPNNTELWAILSFDKSLMLMWLTRLRLYVSYLLLTFDQSCRLENHESDDLRRDLV